MLDNSSPSSIIRAESNAQLPDDDVEGAITRADSPRNATTSTYDLAAADIDTSLLDPDTQYRTTITATDGFLILLCSPVKTTTQAIPDSLLTTFDQSEPVLEVSSSLLRQCGLSNTPVLFEIQNGALIGTFCRYSRFRQEPTPSATEWALLASRGNHPPRIDLHPAHAADLDIGESTYWWGENWDDTLYLICDPSEEAAPEGAQQMQTEPLDETVRLTVPKPLAYGTDAADSLVKWGTDGGRLFGVIE